MANAFDDVNVNKFGFAYLDLIGQGKWETWTVTYSFATATALTVSGRFLIVGNICFFQVKSTGTSLATTAGTSYIDMPVTAKGYGGGGMMFNDTTHVNVGTGNVSVSGNKFYPPTQGASGNDFVFTGSYEV